MNIQVDISNVTLETERLILRYWREEDLDDFYAYASVEGVGEAAGWPHHTSKDDSKRILDKFIAEKNVFAIVDRESGRVVGSFGLHESWAGDAPEYEGRRAVEIGYVLARDMWGRGLMTEAVRSVLDYIFGTLEADVVTVAHFTENDRSRRVIEKTGFTKVGEDAVYLRQLGKTLDDVKYVLTKEEYDNKTQ